MTFSPVPNSNKTQINKAGLALVNTKTGNPDYNKALGIAEEWRACHAYPLNTFNTNLRENIKKIKGKSIVAQRLKRMPTIIDKLKRYPTMQLTQMQDIGGVRAIVDDIKDVIKLAEIYRNSKTRFAHQLFKEKNHIDSPRNEDGYRSHHLIYKYSSSYAPSYNNLLIELQIRTRLQHMWATAVETMDTLTGQALKYRKGQKDWQDFFAIVSSAFAHIEKTTLIQRFSNFDKNQTFKKVALAEEKVKALEQMRGLSIAAEAISKDQFGSGWYYHLIVLDSINKTVNVRSFSKENFEKAVKDYSEFEEKAAKEKVEPVLVAAGQLKDLRKAYPNFFLDVKDFTKTVKDIISHSK